jgi:hypothetical protein
LLRGSGSGDSRYAGDRRSWGAPAVLVAKQCTKSSANNYESLKKETSWAMATSP